MKKKFKNASKGMLIFYVLISIGYIISYIFIGKSLLSLTGIEDLIRYIIIAFFAIYGIIYLIIGWKSIFKKWKKTFITLTILTTIWIPIFIGLSYYIDKIYNNLENLTNKETSTYTSVVIAQKDKEITSESKLGMINNENDHS